MTDWSLKVEGLGKCYHLDLHGKSEDRVSHGIFRRREQTAEQSPEFWAVRDINFTLAPGDILGILGRNGSGKSTLLKILGGIVEPSQGTARLRGRVGALLEVGAGFHPDFSGRENIFLQGAVLGIKQAEIRRAFDQIVDFADIGVFIDVPVKHYSSGMFIRLAFSVALHLRTDILILDEVMAVGDAPFQQKSMGALENLVHDGRTVLFVSHSCDMVARLCNKGMLIDKGKQLYFGSADMAITHYMQMIHHLPIEASPDETDGSERKEPLAADRDLRDAPRVEGSKRHLVTRAVARAADLSPHSEFQTGDTLVIDIHCHCEDATKVYFQLSFMGMDGKRIMSVHSTHGEFALEMGGDGFARCVIPDIRLVTGEYSIMITVGPQPDGSELSWFEHIPDALRIRVRLGSYLGGVGLQPFQGAMAQRSLWHMGAGGKG